MIRVKKIETKEELAQAYRIREVVFIEEMRLPSNEEYDAHDLEAVHFIAYSSGEPVGTSRYRVTDRGVKLERFAVLKPFRGKGVGKRLVQTTLGQISASFRKGTLLYLHAQVDAMPLYVRHGFESVGDKIFGSGIELFEMKKVLD